MEDGSSEGTKKGILSGSGSGILASLCCIGPLVLLLLGLGSVSFALSIGQYRPYFISIGVFFLFLTVFSHLKKNKACNVRGLRREKPFIISAALSMGLIYVLALYVVVPAIGPAVYGDVRGSGPVDTASDLRKVTLGIGGMTCQNCVVTIEGGLYTLDGVIGAKVSYPEGIGEVIYDPGKITKEQIAGSEIFSPETGYTAEVISDEPLKTTLS